MEDQTFIFRIFTGGRYLSGGYRPPFVHYQSSDLPSELERLKQAYRVVEYLFPKANIIRIDNLGEERLVKLLEYDYKRFRLS